VLKLVGLRRSISIYPDVCPSSHCQYVPGRSSFARSGPDVSAELLAYEGRADARFDEMICSAGVSRGAGTRSRQSCPISASRSTAFWSNPPPGSAPHSR